MAGVTGFEPVPTVLETAVLPLTPYPSVRISKYSIDKNKNAIFRLRKRMEITSHPL